MTLTKRKIVRPDYYKNKIPSPKSKTADPTTTIRINEQKRKVQMHDHHPYDVSNLDKLSKKNG